MTDTLQSIIAELRAGDLTLACAADDRKFADRLERIDAEQIKLIGSLEVSNSAKYDELVSRDEVIAELRERLAVAEKAAEVRNNDDGSLDEVCAPGFHLEQMSATHWWLGIGSGPLLHINLHSKATIKATVMDERKP